MGVVVGSRAVPGSTGNFDITGLPFEPVAFLFWNQYNHLGPVSMYIGCATASGEEWVMWTGTDSQTSGYTFRYHESRTDRCWLSFTPPFTTMRWAATFVSMNSDGCTMNLVTRNDGGIGEGNNVYYMAIGGDHITEAHAGTFSAGASTGTVAVTAPGFEPTSLVVAHLLDAAFDAGQLAHEHWGLGLTDGNSHFSSFVRGNQGSGINVRHITRTDAIACGYDATNAYRIEHESFDANGFTVDVVDAWTADIEHGYLAINADGAVAGNGIQPDGNGAVSYGTPGLEPEGVFFCWPGVDSPSSTGATSAPLRPGMGGGTISQQRNSSGPFRDSTPFGVFTSDGYHSPGESMAFWGSGSGIGGADNNSQASADITALTPGSFELTWSSVAGTQDRAFGWLALPGELIAPWIPKLYRVGPR